MGLADVPDGIADPRDVPLGVPLGQLLRVVPELVPGLGWLLGIQTHLLELVLVPGQAVDVDAVLRIAPHPTFPEVGQFFDLR